MRANLSFWSSRGIHKTKIPNLIRNDLAFRILDMLEPRNFNPLTYKIDWWYSINLLIFLTSLEIGFGFVKFT